MNWASLASNLSGLTSALTAVGVTPANMATALNQISSIANPSETEELALLQQIMLASNNPAEVQLLVTKLVTEQGIPPIAAQEAMKMIQPGADIIAIGSQVENLIKSGT